MRSGSLVSLVLGAALGGMGMGMGMGVARVSVVLGRRGWFFGGWIGLLLAGL